MVDHTRLTEVVIGSSNQGDPCMVTTQADGCGKSYDGVINQRSELTYPEQLATTSDVHHAFDVTAQHQSDKSQNSSDALTSS